MQLDCFISFLFPAVSGCIYTVGTSPKLTHIEPFRITSYFSPMGLPLSQRPNVSAGDPVMDDAQLVHDSKGLPPHELPNGSVIDPVLDDAQLVHDSKGLPLHQPPNGTVIDLLLDDTQPEHESNGSVTDPVLDDAQLVHELNGLPLHQRPNESVIDLLLDDAQPVHDPNGSVSDPLQDDTRLVHEPEERDPHVVPTFTVENLTKPRSTVLFLPPFLSSLPQNLSVPQVSVDRPPLVTESRLSSIDPVSLSLHKALHHFGPVSEDYAGLPYADAFNWLNLELPEDEEREWYAVAFRSRRKKGSDSGRKYTRVSIKACLTIDAALYDADRQAHEEAVSNGGVSCHSHFLYFGALKAVIFVIAYYVLVRGP